jgi:hypothetical protein
VRRSQRYLRVWLQAASVAFAALVSESSKNVNSLLKILQLFQLVTTLDQGAGPLSFAPAPAVLQQAISTAAC